MCGRFASARKRMELLEEFGVQRDRVEADLQPDYNVAPTKKVYAVLTRERHSPADPAAKDAEGPAPEASPDSALAPAAGAEGAAPEQPERQLRVVRWGLVPYWAKDPAIGSRMINARAETVAEKPAFRRAFARRRCLLPADGFYEWQQVADADAGGGKRKQPYFIYRADGGVLAFAGLYELWRDPSVAEDDPGSWLWTATIITTRAQDEVGRIHDRMPMVIETSAWQDWLDPANTDVADVGRLLVPAASGGLTSHPVSTAVNNVRNNGPQLTDVLPEAGPSDAPPGPEPSGAHPPDAAAGGSGDTLF
jgi:putative SOS response-associated peptidase YedK